MKTEKQIAASAAELENLGKEYYRLQFLVDAKNELISKEMEVSMQAGEIVGKIYEALLKQSTQKEPSLLCTFLH